MKKKWIAAALLAGFMSISFISGVETTVYAKTDDNHIYEGVSINGMDVSGNTKEEAEKKVAQYMEDLQKKKITFKTDLGKVSMTTKAMGLNYTNQEVVEDAYSYGKVGNIIKRYKEQKDIKENMVDLQLEMTIDTKAIKKKLVSAEEKLVQKAENASLKRKSGKFEIIPEKTGITVDYKSVMSDLKTFLNDTWDGNNTSYELPVTEDTPEYVSADLQEVQDVLGTYTTNYSSSSSDRAENVNNGARLINGTIVYPEEEFSMYEKVHPYTIENGYRVGKAYQNGEVIDSIGGGICQVSTTLYNALIRSELEITERFPHSMIVTYVPLAADAAMAGTYKNLKFKNNTNTPIYIEAVAENRNITFTIYGKETRDSNREIKFRSKTLAVYSPGKDIETKDPSMAEGRVIVTQSAHTGYKAELWKDIYIDGKLTDSELVNTSVYQASPRRVIVGAKKKEEPKEDKKKEEPKDDKKDDKKEDTKDTNTSDDKKVNDKVEDTKKDSNQDTSKDTNKENDNSGSSSTTEKPDTSTTEKPVSTEESAGEE